MTILAIAVYNTPESNRFTGTEKTFNHLLTNTFPPHTRIVAINNGSSDPRTLPFLMGLARQKKILLIGNKENLGTAKAINQGWSLRAPGEPCVKMDDDVLLLDPDWLSQCLECMVREPKIGLVGVKRAAIKDNPAHANPRFRTTLQLLRGNGRDLTVEYPAVDVIGTCTVLGGRAIDTIGGMDQPGVYGYDDSDICARLLIVGFKSAYLPQLKIQEVDTSSKEYRNWKINRAHSDGAAYRARVEALRAGRIPVRVPLPNLKTVPLVHV
jgi:GT2 family glycosyltransferase